MKPVKSAKTQMNPSQKIAFLSMDDLDGFVFDDALAEPFLAELGWEVSTISWRDETVDWASFEAVIIRTTWDYFDFLPEFLKKLEIISTHTKLVNSIETVRWNSDKVYLRELESKGVKIVPTLWRQGIASASEIEQFFADFEADEIIIKPTISAGAVDTFRLNKASNFEPVVKAFQNRKLMVQPFVQSVVDLGEYSVFYFNGMHSHTILKTPKTDDFRVQEEHGGIITQVPHSPEIAEISDSILSKIKERLLYARVDLVKNKTGEFCLMELELVEPALYLRMAPNGPKFFAESIIEFLKS